MNRIYHLVIPVVCAAALFGAAAFSLIAPREDTALATYAGERVVIEGMIVRDIDIRDTSARITVRPSAINGIVVDDSKYILVIADRTIDVSYGDTIRAVGMLRKPEAFDTDTGRVFNYPMFLFTHGISHTMNFAEVTVLQSKGGNPFVRSLFSLKHLFLTGLERALPEPYAALAAGILLGEKQSLGDHLYQAFIASGVVHIVVLSGYNIALVISAVLYVALRIMPRLMGYIFAAVFVIAFAILTGASETTVRATIMGLLMMVARVLHRPGAALRGLMIAAAIMALLNPYVLLYSLSFQLSVVATLGLILFTDPLKRRMRFLPERWGFREIVSSTLATQITVLPLLIFSIGAVSLVFLPANALVLIPVPLAMLFSFVAALVALIVPQLAVVFAAPAYLILAYIIAVSEFFGTLPFALLTIPSSLMWPILGMLFLVYTGIIVGWIRRKVVLK